MAQKEYIQAEIAFNKSLEAQHDFAPALNGLAQVYLEQHHLDLAEQYVQLALQGRPPFLPTRLTEIRLLLANGEYELAREKLAALRPLVFKKNLKLLKAPVLYYSAFDAFKQNRLQRARQFLKLLLSMDGNNQQALSLRDSLDKRTALLNRFPKEIRPLIADRVITRAQTAKLLHVYFGKVIFRYALPAPIMHLYPALSFKNLSDVNRHDPQNAAIQEALEKQLMWAFPDSTFRPKETVSRAEFALILQRLYLRLFPADLHVDCSIRLRDVSQDDFIYRAVCLAVEKKWLASNGHAFNPQRKISAIEAAEALRQLRKEAGLP